MRSEKASLMERVAAFIVDKRNIIFLIYIAAAVFCIFSSGWVEVSDSLTKYLPESTETQIGLELMDDEFTTFGTARIVVENVSYEQAEKICADIERVPGVKEVVFDDSPEHYNEAAALFSVTFDGKNDDEVSVLAMDTLRDMLSVYDLYVNTEVGNPLKAIINRELLIVDGIAALIIVVVLLFTSKTYAEIPVLLITFGAAALLTGDAQTDALAKAAAAFLAQDAQVQQILGERGIEEDGAVWLPAVGAHPQGTLLSTLLCDALRGTLMEGRSAASALRGVTQALDAAR